MSFSVSPQVSVREFDLSTIVPQIASTIAAQAGVFHWGPLEKRVLVDSEITLKSRFGKPSNLNAETWFNAASFLAYGNQLVIARAAVANGTSPVVSITTSNNSATVTTANTSNLAVGMYSVSTSNSLLRVGATIASIINSTAFTISSNGYSLASGNDSVQFLSSNSVYSAIANTASVANLAGQLVKNEDAFATMNGNFDSNLMFVARYPGDMGNSIRVSVCDSSEKFYSVLDLPSYSANGAVTLAMNVGSNTATITLTHNHDGTSANTARITANTLMNTFKTDFAENDLMKLGTIEIGYQVLKITDIGTNNASANSTVATVTVAVQFEDDLRLIDNVSENTSIERYWEFHDLVNDEPGQSEYQRLHGNTAANDELHVVVVDDRGKFSDIPGQILEMYPSLSRATDAKTLDNSNNFWRDVLNTNSKYVWSTNDLEVGYSKTAETLSTMNTSHTDLYFTLGSDGATEYTIPLSALTKAYDLFSSAEEMDVSIVMQGVARGGAYGTTLANYLIDNIAEVRKDCIITISPEKGDVVNAYGNEVDNMVAFRDNLRASSYGFMDSGYKYMYDRYNDVYRWIPLNGDMAGLMVRTDETNDAWWSPAGYNRGNVKNVVKLAFNPRKAYRDALYKKDINPVVSFPGQGTVLFGDKTLLGKPSAFDRINVRRLFIVVEKAIATAAKYFLFEFNDDFTRAQFRNMVIPYLREVQGKRGIYDFLFVCDSTNNTPEIIDTNRLVGDIYIKPARSVNFINLNFIAVKTGVSFSEVVGKTGA